MAISKGFRYKDKEGKVTDYEYGVNGSNVTQDSEHRLVTDEEKQTWNDKADLEDIPSGSAASHAVANNCTTTAAGSVLDARQGKVLMDKANQLSSELKFPDGTKFYPDIQDGEYGFNTAADRGADTFHPFKADWELVLKITFGAASNNKGGIYSNDDAATDTPHGWYSSMNSTIRCVNGEITVTGKCACAGRFGNQNDVAGYISNITVVSFSYL